MSHLSIICTPSDKDFAEQLGSDLQANGIPVTLDVSEATLELSALNDAIAVVIILTPDAMSDNHLLDIVALMLNSDQVVLPVVTEPAPMPAALEQAVWLDMSTSALYDAHLQKLIGMLTIATTLVPPEFLPAGFSVPPPDTSVWNGVDVDVALNRLSVPSNTIDLCNAQLRRYVSILAVMSSPLAMSQDGVIGHVADITMTWRNLANALLTAYRSSDNDDGLPFALRRLAPPTADHLRDALSIGTPDAYPIVHWFAPHVADTVALETEGGLEDTVDPLRFVSLFRESHAQLLIAATGLHEDLIAILLDRTSIEAVVTVQGSIPPMAEFLFNSRFYGQILAGQSVDTAFEHAITALQRSHPQAVEHFNLHRQAGCEPVYITVPAETTQAELPLIDPGMPRLRNVPVILDFVGQELDLHDVDVNLLDDDTRLLAIYGESGVGKSWLANEYVARFAWNYPDGIVWMRIGEQTKAEDVLGQLAALLELPADIAPGDLRVRLRDRDVLVVLDQADEWGDPLEVAELADFVERVDIAGGVRFLLTAQGPVEPLTRVSDTHSLTLEPMSPDDAATLIHRLITSHDLQQEFDGVEDGLSQFLTLTQNTPWLIREGMQMVRRNGLEAALEDLTGMVDEVAHQVEYYVELQLDAMTDDLTDARQFLRQLQGIPDSFDRNMAESIGGASTAIHLRALLRRDLLGREGALYTVPAAVRASLRYRMPLSDEEQDHIDQLVIQHLLSRGTWSRVLAMAITATRLTRQQQALLNNLRAVIKRQIRPLSSVDPMLVAKILLANSDTMLDAVLAAEQYDYLDQVRRQIPEGTIEYAHLTSHMAVMMDAVDDYREQAAEVHQAVLHELAVLQGEEQHIHAEAMVAYGRHLINTNALEAAHQQFQAALELLTEMEDQMVVGVAFGDLARAYADQNLFEVAAQHFQTALGVLHNPDSLPEENVQMQVDFAAALIPLAQYEKADALLNNALASCDHLGLWAHRGQVRRALAYLAQQQADAETDEAIRQDLLDQAEATFQQAVSDLLPVADTPGLAAAYHDLGRLQMQKHNYVDAHAHIEKSHALLKRLGSHRQLAIAGVSLGQVVLLADGDADQAIQHLRRALNMAQQAQDPSVRDQVVQSLIRVHQLQLRRAVSQPPSVRQHVIEQVNGSRQQLVDMGLTVLADPLDAIVMQLEAMEKSSDAPPAV